MVIEYQVLIHEPCPPGVQKREFARVCGDAGRAAARQWHQEILKRHFTYRAAGRYGYQPRKPDYLKQKHALARKGKAIEGGRVDLVLSGLMREMLLASAQVRVSTGLTALTMVGPRYTNIRRAGSPDKAAEITRVIDEEREQLATTQQRVAVDELSSLHEPKTTRIG
jgi:hypothetical protein